MTSTHRYQRRLWGGLRHIAISFALFLVARGASATEQWIASTIKNVYTMNNGNFVLIFNTQWSGQYCNAQGQYFWVTVGTNGMTIDGAKSLLATSLAAAAQHQQVGVAFDDASSSCYVNRMWVSY